MKEFYEERLDLLNRGESFVLASIFDSKGSAPRTTGARMIIKKDGSIIGTVGGGKVEALVIEHGAEIHNTKTTVFKEYKLQESDNKGIGMACGGDVSILMEYVDAEDTQNIQLYKAVNSCIKNGEKAFIIRKFLKDGSIINFLYKDGRIIFNAEDCDKEDIDKYAEAVRHRDLLLIKDENEAVLVEPICNLGRVYIFGAGHVSKSLATVAKKIDFMVTVIDDRAEFARSDRFPNADEIIVPESYEDCFKGINIDKDSYIVIVTRGHLYDLTTLKQALKTEAYYIGMIGSRRKRDTIYEALKKDGFTIDDFNRVHNPIGLEIGAETPEEIAISIAAELIKVRRERMK